MRNQGFTLIEVMGALVIFAGGVIVATALSSGLSALIRDAKFRSETAVIGRQTLDSLSTLEYDDFSVGSATENTVTVDGEEYTRSWTVTQTNVRTLEILVNVAPPIDDELDCLGSSFCGSIYVVEEW